MRKTEGIMKSTIVINVLFYSFLGGFLSTSCVSKKVFSDLQSKYALLKEDKEKLQVRYDGLLKDHQKSESLVDSLKTIKADLEKQQSITKSRYEELQQIYGRLQQSYDLLSDKSAGMLADTARENSKLLTQLSEKQAQLAKEANRIEKMQSELKERSARIETLEQLIAEKENALIALKQSISQALHSFEGKGLAVTQKNGRVYVSMENKLLFKPGSWKVGSAGVDAVTTLAKVLVQNPDINVLIEGHTDTDPYNSNAIIKDNWDLSVKRATAIVRILEKNKVNPIQITAAGRSSYVPVASNKTREGKAKNRRIEIILSPNIDAINNLLQK